MFKEFRSTAKGVPDLLNYCMLVNDGTLLLKDGAFCAGWSYRGPDLNSSEDSDLELLSANVNNVLCQLGNGWMIHTDMLRRSSQRYPDREASHFPDPVSLMIDEERRIQYEAEGVHYESEYTIILTFLPPTEIESQFSNLFIDGVNKKTKSWNHVLDQFEEKIKQIENVLSRLLILDRLDSNQMLTVLHQYITGLPDKIKMPSIPVYLDTLLGTQDLIGGFYPKVGNKHLRIIAIEGFPLEAEPGLLKILDQLPIAFRWSNRFILLDPPSAIAELKKYRRNWFQKRHGIMGLVKEILSREQGTSTQNLDALEMTDEVDQAIKDAESGLVRYGFYNSVIVVHEEDPEKLDNAIKLIYEELCNRGFVLRTETINAMEAFIGSLPGHGYQNVRRPLIHSLNLADILPLTSVWSGLEYNPCKFYPKNSPPLLYAATDGATPFRINLHVNDVAHTAIFGATGNGKSSLIATMCAQFFRYEEAQVFLFDKGYSAYVLCKALGGTHYDILSPKQSPAFYPLKNIHEPDELNWACEWIEECLKTNNFSVNNIHRNSIRDGLIRLSKSESRTLTELQSSIQDRDIQQALEFFTLSGEMGSVLDAAQDGLRDGRFQVFEMDNIIQKGEARLLPTLLYIFHQITKCLNGRPTLILIEEGHHFTKGKFGEQLDKWLLELAGREGSCIYFTLL